MALKYRIKELVDNLPRSFNLTEALEKFEIPQRTFHNDKSIPAKTKTSIPSDRLRKYAMMLGVSMEELYTPAKSTFKSKLKTALS